MQLKEKSFHATVFKIFYNTSYLPNNLCPYFWKLAFALTMFLPAAILFLPITIISIISGDYREDWETRIIGSLLVYLALFGAWMILSCLYDLVLAIFGAYSYDYIDANFGIVFVIAGSIILLRHLYIIKRKPKVYREKRPSIITEFVKAKYNNYCPKIKWDE